MWPSGQTEYPGKKGLGQGATQQSPEEIQKPTAEIGAPAGKTTISAAHHELGLYGVARQKALLEVKGR